MVVGCRRVDMRWRRESSLSIPEPFRADHSVSPPFSSPSSTLGVGSVSGSFSTAVAALMSLLSLLLAVWGLHLRLRFAQAHWKEEAVMVRRRSMALSVAGGGGGGAAVGSESNAVGQLGGVGEKNGSNRWSDAPESYYPSGAKRGSMAKEMGDEESLEAELEMARRNSRDQEMMVRRASWVISASIRSLADSVAPRRMVSPNDGPYASVQGA